jgi:hypothetical protein
MRRRASRRPSRRAAALLSDLLAHLRTVRAALDRGLPFPSEGVTEVRDLLLEAEHAVECLRHSGQLTQLTEVDVAMAVMILLDGTEAVLRVAASAHRRTGSRHTSVGVN